MAQPAHDESKIVTREQINLTTGAVSRCHGRIRKDRGDGYLIEFNSCSNAVRCGYLIQQYVEERNRLQSDARLKFELRVGIDFGEAIGMANGDLRGNAVNMAARVCDVAPEGEVYFTEKVAKELNPREASVEMVGRFPLKGIKGEVSIYRLKDWLGPVESSPDSSVEIRASEGGDRLDRVESSPNPFIWRDGITRVEDFFGREYELSRLCNFLSKRQNCQIVGERRIGKTSLLRQVEIKATEWETSAVVAYVDQQDARCHTRQGWLKYVGRKWHLGVTVSDLAEFSEQVDEMRARNLRPVLCMDEFEEMSARPTEFTHDFFVALRACGQKGLAILTASKKPLHELTDPQDRSSEFFNTFPLLRLGTFTAKEAEDFVNTSRRGVTPFTPEEKQTILINAKQHPLVLQILCDYVLEAKDRETISAALRKAEAEIRAMLQRGW
jgi:hypothetical protein